MKTQMYSLLQVLVILVTLAGPLPSIAAEQNESADLATQLENAVEDKSSFHLAAAAGGTFSTFKSNEDKRDFGFGTAFKTDLYWEINDRWAAESSGLVRFNPTDNGKGLVWHTLLTLGGRRNFAGPVLGLDNCYSRAFFGYGASVYYPRHKLTFGNTIDRFQAEGSSLGFGLGRRIDRKNSLTWFYEVNSSVHYISRIKGIHMEGETPVVTTRLPVARNSNFYSVDVVIGMVLF